jgi:hypothetical protein
MSAMLSERGTRVSEFMSRFTSRTGFLREGQNGRKCFIFNWLPPRDSNPDMLIQSQLSYH